MPLRHSPTPSTSASDQPQTRAQKAQKCKQKTLLQHFESEKVYSNTSEDDERAPSRQVERSKRKHDCVADNGNMQSAVAEMRILFANLSSKNEAQFSSLRSSIESFKSEINEITKSLEFLTETHEVFQDKIAKLEAEKADNHKRIQVLENRVETLERKSRNSSLELRNVPKLKQSENKNHLCEMITGLGNSLELNIQAQDISDVYRVQTQSESSNPIVVEFVSAMKKETVLNSIRRFNKDKKKEDKLNSKHFKIEGPQKPVFVSESLTQRVKKLFYLARDFAKTQGYDYCWSSNGSVYLRKKENLPLIRVSNETDLAKLLEKQ